MPLTLNNPQVDALVNEVAQLTGESKTEAVRKALLDRRDRLLLFRSGVPKRDLGRFLESHVWPAIPAEVLGRELTKQEIEDYLGFDTGGV